MPSFLPKYPNFKHTTQQLSVRLDSIKYNQLGETFVLCLPYVTMKITHFSNFLTTVTPCLPPTPLKTNKHTHTSYSKEHTVQSKNIFNSRNCCHCQSIKPVKLHQIEGSIILFYDNIYKVHHIMYKITKNVVVLSILHYLFKVPYHNFKKCPA